MIQWIQSARDMELLAAEYGFLPLFRNEIPGYSVEEHTPPELWFPDDETIGPWAWKGAVAGGGACAYGKFYRSRAAFVSLEWLPDLVNHRRDGYDFEGWYEDGNARYQDKALYEAIARAGSLNTFEIKRTCGDGVHLPKGYEGTIARLQMQTFLCIADFDYPKDRFGRPYGWGVARYTTPEKLFGEEALAPGYARAPGESKRRLWEMLRGKLPGASEKQITRIVG